MGFASGRSLDHTALCLAATMGRELLVMRLVREPGAAAEQSWCV